MSKQTLESNIRLFNIVRDTLSPQFKDRIPQASITNFYDIGTMITRGDLQIYANEWIDALVNRIGLVFVSSKMLRNKLKQFITGSFDYGDLIQNIYVEIPEAKQYVGPELYGDGEVCLPNPWCKEKPWIDTIYHRRNRQEFYKQTIFMDTLKKAFTGATGFQSLIEAIIQSMYSALEADNYLWTKQLFSRYITAPQIPLKSRQIVEVDPVIDEQSGKDFYKSLKTQINYLGFNSSDFNPYGKITYNDPDSLVLFYRADLSPILEVETLAGAFNQSTMEESRVNIIMVDDFGEGTWNDTTEEGVVAMLVDRSWFMIYQNLMRFESLWNPEGLYWNYWLHTWWTFATNYFKNAIIFTSDTSIIPPPPPTPLLEKEEC